MESGEVIATSKAVAREILSRKGMDPAQITGACSSYARKYAICALLAIGPSLDMDELKPESKENTDLYKMLVVLEENGINPDYFAKVVFKKPLDKLTKEQIHSVTERTNESLKYFHEQDAKQNET